MENYFSEFTNIFECREINKISLVKQNYEKCN